MSSDRRPSFFSEILENQHHASQNHSIFSRSKKSEEKLTRKDIVEILINDYHVPESTAYRYYVDAQNEYLWQQEKSGNPVQRNKRQEVLDNIWDIALNARTEKDDEKYLRTIERWSKLSTLFKKA